MTVEHRAAPDLNDIEVELADHGEGPAMRLRRAGPAEAAPEPETPEQRIVQTLADAETPLSQRQIRERAATRPATVGAPRPRARLGHAPTPIDPAPNLGAALGNDLWIKRDDCTGLAFGGNKVRQIEFHFGEAEARGADTVLVTGAVQSNLVRIAAAAARKLGMAVHIQLEDRVDGMGALYRTSGNLLLDRVLGATLHPFPEGEDEAAADAAMERRAAVLAAEGRKPYVIHSASGHPPLGGLLRCLPRKRARSRPGISASASMPLSAPRGARSPMPPGWPRWRERSRR